MKKLFIILSIFITTYSQAQTKTYLTDKNSVPRERFVDFTALKLSIAFEPKKKQVNATVEHKFKVLRQSIDTLFLDGIRLKYLNVLLDNQAVAFDSTANGITLNFEQSLLRGEEHTITIEYEAQPKKGIYFIGWDDSLDISRKQIWTQGQGIDNRHWIPMYDERNDKVISEIVISFDTNYQVLSNGRLIENSDMKLPKGNHQKIWHYKISKPHSPYLIMLGIGKYGIARDTSYSGIPLENYYYPEQPEQVEPTYRYTKEMFAFFEKEIGVPYPWAIYSQIPVQNFMYGAMENTTATIFGDFYLVDSSEYLDRNYVRVNAHELAHQWFGNLVTARAADDHWLQESFATHYDMMYQKEAFGKDYFDWVRRDYNNQSIEASKSDLKPLAHSEAGSVRHYPKGAFVLQMLKYAIGREDFNLGVQAYLNRHAFENVDSDDLLSAFHDELGYSLNWFWEDWIYQGGEPNYKVTFNEKRGKGTFEVVQINRDTNLTGNFKMPVIFEVHFANGDKEIKRVWVENDSTIVEFNLAKRNYDVEFVLFDPNNQIMKSIDFEKSSKMLKAQAEKAEHMLDRYDAIVALESLKLKKKEEFYAERFEKETFYGIKTELLKQLKNADAEIKYPVFAKALQDEDAEVRKAALIYIGKLNEQTEPLAKKLLNDPSNKVVELALEVLVINDLKEGAKYLELTKNKVGNRSSNIRITWLKIDAIINKSQKSKDELVDFTSNSYEFLTRLNAFSALRDVNYLDDELLYNLKEAKFHFNSTLRRAAAQTLDYFYEKEEFKPRMKEYFNTSNLTEREMKALEKYR